MRTGHQGLGEIIVQQRGMKVEAVTRREVTVAERKAYLHLGEVMHVLFVTFSVALWNPETTIWPGFLEGEKL